MTSGRDCIDELPSELRRWTSPVLFGLHETLGKVLTRFATGSLLDVGCGAMPYRQLLSALVTDHDGLDRFDRVGGLTYMDDAQQMGKVPSGMYDTVLASEVLEHVPEPDLAVAAMYRVLRPGGIAIISVPHLSRLHELPHDYTRWTGSGLRQLLQRNRFVVLEVIPTGYLCSFLFHQVAVVWMNAVGRYGRVVRATCWLSGATLVIPARLLDRLPFMDRFPVGHVAVAKRPE